MLRGYPVVEALYALRLVKTRDASEFRHEFSAQEELCGPLVTRLYFDSLQGRLRMGLFQFLRNLFFGRPSGRRPARTRAPRKVRPKLHLVPLRRQPVSASQLTAGESCTELPYRFANYGWRYGEYVDISQDSDAARLAHFGLPVFHTPELLADWLGLSVGKVAWLIHKTSEGNRPRDERHSHYYYRWLKKRSGGVRLIEAPKPILKDVQHRILREILAKIPNHPSAHGFVAGKSIVSNARPHVGNRVVLKLDLENFYPNVRFNRVVAIFRSVGYSREAAIWLARLTTSALPWKVTLPRAESDQTTPYFPRHLPQGAPTSPALANLSAYSLDVRLSGLARSFGAHYTRYADDLTFSGPERFLRSLAVFIPLVHRIVRAERFRANHRKRRVIRNNQRQSVTGVVVNDRTNISRAQFDRIKAILTNCERLGPGTQNRDGHDDFAAHLRGQIAHVAHLNPARGEKLLDVYRRINWSR